MTAPVYVTENHRPPVHPTATERQGDGHGVAVPCSRGGPRRLHVRDREGGTGRCGSRSRRRRIEFHDAHGGKLQRSGYASALRSPRVLDAIRSGAHGRIAVAYVEWSGEGAATVAVDWTTLEDAATVEALAHRIQSFVPGPVKARRAGRTSISYGIRFSLSLFDKQISVAERRVIDVSGDGENNDGEDVTSARDAAVRAGVTINGLAMGDEATEGETIADYYAREVVAGAGSFVEAVDDLRGFAHAMERKLWREIAAEPAASTTKVALGVPNPSGRTAMLLLRRDRAVPWMPF